MSESRTIAVIGGGCAGTLAAANLLRTGAPVHVVIVEPSGDPGPGAAYSTPSEHHVLNVPARVLGATSSEPEAFLAWLREQGEAVEPGDFVPRARYGAYLRHVLAQAEAHGAGHGATLSHAAARAVDVTCLDGRELVQIDDGSTIDAHAVVLALGSAGSARPKVVPELPGVFASPWQPGALDPLESGADELLLVGSGLTAIDAALSTCAASPTAHVTMISRTGLLPRAHSTAPAAHGAPAPAWPTDPLTADALVASFHTYHASIAELGFDWRTAVDATRPHVQQLWARMSHVEQVRFRTHHSRTWELHRHRMAPQVAARLHELFDAGRVTLLAAGLGGLELDDPGLRATLTPSDGAAQRELRCARVIDCTGVDGAVHDTDHQLLRELVASGRATPDAHGLGLRANAAGWLLDSTGTAQPTLGLLGHLRRGELWESTAVVEIRAQAEVLATELSARFTPVVA